MLPISKKDYIAKSDISKMVHISPLTTLAGFFGSGELFHSRTKTPQKNVWTSSSRVGEALHLRIGAYTKMSEKETSRIYTQIVPYIKKHHIPLDHDLLTNPAQKNAEQEQDNTMNLNWMTSAN